MKENIYAPLNKWHRFDADLYNKIVAVKLQREKDLKRKFNNNGNIRSNNR